MRGPAGSGAFSICVKISKKLAGLKTASRVLASLTYSTQSCSCSRSKAVKQHALAFQDTKYELATIVECMKALINMKQKDDEALLDFKKRFKTANDVFKSHQPCISLLCTLH